MSIGEMEMETESPMKEAVFQTEKYFQKRECIRIIPTSVDKERCCCGLRSTDHQYVEPDSQGRSAKVAVADSWSIEKDTKEFPTDAYGLIEFQGGLHPRKAHFVRMSFDSKPQDMLRLLEEHWKLGRPKLVISIYGSVENFDLHPQLAQVFAKGLVRTIKTTDTWIICNGINSRKPFLRELPCGGVQLRLISGLSRCLAAVFETSTIRLKRKVVMIGVAPWGMLKNRDDFLLSNVCGVNEEHCVVENVAMAEGVHVPYHSRRQYHPQSRYSTLSSVFTHFLLVDNGTTHRYGAEMFLRRRLEEYIRQQILIETEANCKHVPVVGVLVKGGVATLRTILDCVTNAPALPVVVLDGSGGAADLLGIADLYNENAELLPEKTKAQLLARIRAEFTFKKPQQAEWVFHTLMLCARRKKKMHVFRLGETGQGFDSALLTALLNAQQRMPLADRLALTLTWNRADVASEYIFTKKRDLDMALLEATMMDALIHDKFVFLPLVLKNGVSMDNFLTPKRLELLYNKSDEARTLLSAMEDVKPEARNSRYRYTLPDIGAVMTQLMGGIYDAVKYRQGRVSRLPFNDLFIWAVLTERHSMALCMWRNGYEAMAKALVAIKLNYSLSNEAAETPNAEETCAQLDDYAEEFRRLSLELLSQCYRIDHSLTLRLLTRELENWGNETCLSLAVRAGHKEFIAHPACQLLLSDLWQGGLMIRSGMDTCVLMALLIPPFLFALEFKTKEELMMQAQRGDKSKQFADVAVARPEQGGARTDDATTELSCLEKVREFYTAPITKFWLWTISYFIFLSVYTWFVLLKKPERFSWQEYFLVGYAFVFGCDLLRELFMSERERIWHKFKSFARRRWNLTLLLAVIMLLVAAAMRAFAPYSPNFQPTTLAHLLYSCNIIVWYVRLLDVMGVHHLLGPYIIMFGKTVTRFLYLSTIFAVLLTSHGVAKQAISKPNETEWKWHSLRDAVYKSYFMVFGELVFPNTIDECGDRGENCSVGHWVPPILQALYFLFVGALLLNLLIATVNNVFTSVNERAETIWKFHRYKRTTEYELKPLLPPPFAIFSHVVALMSHCWSRFCRPGDRRGQDLALKLVLNAGQTRTILEFEAAAIEEMRKESEMEKSKSPEDCAARGDKISERLVMKLEDVAIKAAMFREEVRRAEDYVVRIDRHARVIRGLSNASGGSGSGRS